MDIWPKGWVAGCWPGPERKQMAHSNGVIEESLMKGLLTHEWTKHTPQVHKWHRGEQPLTWRAKKREKSLNLNEKAVDKREGLLTRVVAFNRGTQKMPSHGPTGNQEEESPSSPLSCPFPSPPLLPSPLLFSPIFPSPFLHILVVPAISWIQEDQINSELMYSRS